ncbi:ATR-interacting protein [Brachionichthys hirsutus]|uniref:ATR-interacting protein n=1 Tax=Brachionichthys hirsutus TaxID=412623 RepID=UPI003604AE61
MNCRPTKRPRGLDQDVAVVKEFDDPFGDDEDFTQDDLNEIDIASQAITLPAASGLGSNTGSKPTELATSMCGFGSGADGNAEPLGEQQRVRPEREDSYRLLEAQHADLKRKLKEVEDGIVLKSGEIRVLRDSLKGAQRETEAQKQSQLLLETRRQREQSEREKELMKKVQSLEAELQFKEAEMNEMKGKLLSSDKTKLASPLPRGSPKVLSGSGSSPSGNGFITKETLETHVLSKATPVRVRRNGGGRGTSSSKSGDRQEVAHPDPFLSIKPAPLHHRGGALLALLLQQPLLPSSLGLSHLLSMSLTDTYLTSSGLSADFLVPFDAAVGRGGAAAPRTALGLAQSLAVTGLNMLSQAQPEAAASSRNGSSYPGAVLLLPVLDLHLTWVCRALDSLHSAADSDATFAGSRPAGRTAGTAGLERRDEGGFTVEDVGLAALRLVYFLVAQSDEVVEAVLSKDVQSGARDKETERSAEGVPLCSQNSLLRTVLKLCEARPGSCSSQREKLVLIAMKTVCVLIERTPHAHSDRLACILQVLLVCWSPDSGLRTVSACLSAHMSMCDHQTLARQLCSQHDPCIFLKLFQFITSRADIQATRSDWIQLDLQLVRLLSRMLTQTAESWTTSQESSCPCYTELVQTVVVVFHRQWLDLHGSLELTGCNTSLICPPGSYGAPQPSSAAPWWRGDAAALLRECLLLLHWLLLHHDGFTESCRPLLHMYDQVIPAVRDLLRKIPELSESEELALEEICRSESDDTDDMDVDTIP